MSLAFNLLALWGVVLVVWIMLMILLFCICQACYPSPTPHPDDGLTAAPRCTCSDLYVSGVVKDVQDGNGFTFSPQCRIHPSPKDISVRLAGIVAPAMPKPTNEKADQSFAQDAADFLAKLILKKALYIDKYGMERGTQFAWVFLPQEGSPPLNVNLEMVKQGLADVHKGNRSQYGDQEGVIVKLLEEAKDKKRGFWSLINEPTFKRPSDYNKQVDLLNRAQQTHQYKQKKPSYAKQNKLYKQSEQGKCKSKQECTIA